MKKVNESKHIYERGTWYVCERERERERRGTFVRETWYIRERERDVVRSRERKTWYAHERDRRDKVPLSGGGT